MHWQLFGNRMMLIVGNDLLINHHGWEDPLSKVFRILASCFVHFSRCRVSSTGMKPSSSPFTPMTTASCKRTQ